MLISRAFSILTVGQPSPQSIVEHSQDPKQNLTTFKPALPNPSVLPALGNHEPALYLCEFAYSGHFMNGITGLFKHLTILPESLAKDLAPSRSLRLN